MNKQEQIKHARQHFPVGTLVVSPIGNIFTVAKQQFTTPKEDDWFDGIYYWAMNQEDLCVMADGKCIGHYLCLNGMWAKKIDMEMISRINIQHKELVNTVEKLLLITKVKSMASGNGDRNQQIIDNAYRLLESIEPDGEFKSEVAERGGLGKIESK